MSTAVASFGNEVPPGNRAAGDSRRGDADVMTPSFAVDRRTVKMRRPKMKIQCADDEEPIAADYR
jgi:hypothetical protein